MLPCDFQTFSCPAGNCPFAALTATSKPSAEDSILTMSGWCSSKLGSVVAGGSVEEFTAVSDFASSSSIARRSASFAILVTSIPTTTARKTTWHSPQFWICLVPNHLFEMSPTLLHIILRHSSIIQELGTVLQFGEESFITQIRTKFLTVLCWHPTGCIEK